jgi:hypothetical protein
MVRTITRRTGKMEYPPDTGCEYGGSSCLDCRLAACIWDMTGYEFKQLQRNRKGIGRSILEMSQRKKTPREIAQQYGVTERTVWRWVQEYQ